jgi:hypothetical protein
VGSFCQDTTHACVDAKGFLHTRDSEAITDVAARTTRLCCNVELAAVLILGHHRIVFDCRPLRNLDVWYKEILRKVRAIVDRQHK